ncbi:TPA: hypothetical protein RNX34_002131 [Pasteurella multocida]|uniref:hypothetical protein n=1 Tax=Pasteurella multocida TaxID=747 RepID=UPI001093C8DA|nr:hypothetical protein [Pasteurella multocida]UWZ92301.1 hypothetical protein HZ320_00785 [[Pasteurella] aerogenes]QCA32178.1 hypothetical protein E5U06_09775 [Pasteurella multocida]QXG51748.1 hypothetical protein KSF84_01375 [Pasteurella multocida]WGE13628.1 hypothetical protein PM3_0256 [Pasteurella multocida]HDX0990397.1 hypothetical protein [Pasteurella multocida]
MKFIIDKNNFVKIESTQQLQMLRYNWGVNENLYSIIKRQKERRKIERPLGDNCPMLYALKNSDGLSVDDETIKKLFLYARDSIKDYFKTKFPFDAVIVMPSKHNIGYKLAHIIGELYQVHIITNYLTKNTPDAVINEIIHNPDIQPDTKQRIKTAIQRNMNHLSIKGLQPKDRKYVSVLVNDVAWLPVNTRKVLLIDDIYSSGSTLNSAKKLVKQLSPQVEVVSALTLFSPLSKKYI